MKGDISRSTWTPRKHYSSVRGQQGRVQLDADWNEQADIQAHLRETGVADTVGRCGVPESGGGFAIGIAGNGGDLSISPGRIYVDGILCELEADGEPVTYLTQPDFPGALLPSDLDEPPEPLAGTYLAYLDVWRRHVTMIEDPEIRERALGGPDTATRLKTVAQVKLLAATDADEEVGCTSQLADWAAAVAASTGTLRARTQPGAREDDPCVIPASAGYTRLENQLYRVEIHGGGELGEATFKWSRNNGSLATEWLGQDATNPNLLRVGSTGRDRLEGFENAWLEITDDGRDLRGERGQLVRGVTAGADTIEIAPEGQTIDFSSAGANPKIRRWDQPVDGDGAPSVEIAGGNDGYLRIESGIEVRFEAGTYRTGDYWLIPARAFIGEFAGDIEWPQEAPGQGVPRSPAGIEHHYCRLGLVEFAGEEFTGEPTDCRPHFPALTELTSFFKIGGDGQSARPGRPLPCPLAVGVRNGEWPVVGVSVEFAVGSDHGTLQRSDGESGSSVVVTTDEAGIATCAWILPEATAGDDEGRGCVAAAARLLDDSLAAAATPLYFTGELSVAREVAYDPSDCPPLAEAGARTVQAAIDALCQGLGLNQPGIAIEQVHLLSRDLAIDFESDIESADLAAGLAIRCAGEIAPEAFAARSHDLFAPGRPNCTLEIELPYPLGEVSGFWDVREGSVGFQRITLAAIVDVEGDTILWRPRDEAAGFLSQGMLNRLRDGLAARVQAHLTVKGNFVWGAGADERPELYVDGDVYGGPADAERVTGLFPTGDGVPGGDFEMWFWIVPSETAPVGGLLITALARGRTVSGTVLSDGAALPGVVVVMTHLSTGESRTTVTTASGEFTFAEAAIGRHQLSVTVGGQSAQRTVNVVQLQTVGPGPTDLVIATSSPSPTFTFRPPFTASPSLVIGGGVVGGGGVRGGLIAAEPPTRVAGIGPVRGERLADAGIGTLAELADADAAAIAEALGVSDQVAAEFVEAARGLLPPGSGRATTEVNGIGDVISGRLAAGGISDLADLAAAEPASVAEILSISEVRAMRLVEAARGLVSG